VRTTEGCTCFFEGRRHEGGCLTLLSSSLTDEGRAVVVFGDPWATEAFCVIEGLGPE
jgi:hypothetical protein